MALMGLHPFDPAANKPIPLPGGSFATEYSGTWQDDQGQWFTAPQIWWDPQGNPAWLGGDEGRNMALLYEQMGNMGFPRFGSVQEADAFAALNARLDALEGRRTDPTA